MAYREKNYGVGLQKSLRPTLCSR